MGNSIIDQLAVTNTTKIILLVMDGLGGLPISEGGKTELQTAGTPNLDRLAAVSGCGLLDPVRPGVTPGSGPAHLALFGYDPVACNIGRGVLAALGINFPLKHGDVAARINFATVSPDGLVTDRRAGRISTEENRRICEKLRSGVRLGDGVEWFVETVKEHRAVLVLRGENLHDAIEDTDPQSLGVKPGEVVARDEEAGKTAAIISDFVWRAGDVLADEPKANMVLLRGFASYRKYPTIRDRFRMSSLALASYPMYKGLARLVGMEVYEGASNIEETIEALRDNYQKYDFFFVHYKNTDSRGEDGDFQAKVKAIEEMDRLLPGITDLEPDVLAVTGDHSTPAVLKSHSWHPVPVLIRSRYMRPDDVGSFDEISCAGGAVGRLEAINLMSIMMACALRLKKFGA